jgi:hypothetical protein
MLGPIDLDDWQFDDSDMIAAELRMHPLIRSAANSPKLVAKALAGAPKSVSTLLKAFVANKPLSADELALLKANLPPFH